MLKKAYLSIALLLLFYPLYSQTESDSPSSTIDDSIPETVSPNTPDSEGAFFTNLFKRKQNIERTPTQIKNDAKKIESDAIKKAKKIKYDATKNAIKIESDATKNAKKIESDANEKAKKIESDANEKAKKITSRAEVRQEFLNENSLLVLAVFALLTISGLLMYVYHVWTWRKKIDNNSISLPETLRDDIDKVLKKVPLLSTKEEVEEYGKEVVKSFNRVEAALPKFAGIIDDTISGLDKKADQNYSEGLKLLRDQLELKEAKLSEKSNLKLKKKYILEVLEIKKRILFAKNNQSDELGDSFDIIIDKVDRFLKNEGVKVLSFEKGNALEKMLPFEFEKVESVQTNSDSLDQTICETVEIGYYLEAPNDKKAVIIPAKVSIYVPIQESESVE